MKVERKIAISKFYWLYLNKYWFGKLLILQTKISNYHWWHFNEKLLTAVILQVICEDFLERSQPSLTYYSRFNIPECKQCFLNRGRQTKNLSCNRLLYRHTVSLSFCIWKSRTFFWKLLRSCLTSGLCLYKHLILFQKIDMNLYLDSWFRWTV